MKRKVNQVGANTLTVSLPSKWVKSIGLKKGDEIEVTEQNSNLLISTTVNLEPNLLESSITIKSAEETYIRTILNHCYRKGVSRIVVNYENEVQFNHILQSLQNNMIGFEVSKKEENKCIIENLAEPTDDKFDSILRRCFLIIQECSTLLKEDLAVGSISNRDYVIRQINKETQYDNFCKRNISIKKFNTEYPFEYWSLLTYLLLVGHCIKHIYNCLEKSSGNNIKQEIIDYFDDYQALYKILSDSVFKMDSSQISSIHSMFNKNFYKKGYILFAKSHGTDTILLHYISDMMRYTYLMTASAPSIIEAD